MTTFHVSAHPWHAPLQKPLFWWALGFPLRDHHFLAEVLHTQLKNAMLLLYGLAWLMVFWPRSWVRAFSRRQRWAAIMGVSLSLILISSLKRLSATSCPWEWQEFGGLAQPLSHWAVMRRVGWLF